MALSLFKIRRWWLMLTGKSVWHVNQEIGQSFTKDSIKGYYNNLTEKVMIIPSLLENDLLPVLPLEDGSTVEMPVAIFQYGLGAYDLYLKTNEDKYLRKFSQSVKWAMEHLDDNGRWSNFYYVYPDNPYGAMAQGEGTSLLLRAYISSKEERYLEAAKKAIDYMLKPLEKGGTTLFDEENIIFAEYTHLPIVMNGWIFAWWGLYDYVLAIHDNGYYKKILDISSRSLERYLPKFKAKYWSKYDLGGKIASPFYHNLHVAQMQAMYQLTGREIYNEYAIRWEQQQHNLFCKSLAFIKKAAQKLMEKE